MLSTIVFLILIFLSFQVLPVAIGINVGGKPAKTILLILILSATQLSTYWLGLKLGSTFMYLMEGFKGIIVFIGFVLIGIRMLMEVFNIRKGERTYSIDSVGYVAMASFAQGINSFLVGLMYYFILIDERDTLIILFAATIVISIVGITMKPGKLTLAFASLLYTLGGLVMLFAAVYFSFFYL
ncbi:MAG: hypothetical protein HQ521_21435 [Bacteroidetes bacterium]|nr:hypothetical protein [Bacteroidota bacterium]